jgi:hypothetical protein
MNCRKLQKSEYSKWDTFLNKSPQSNIYCYTTYLNVLLKPYAIYVVKKDEEILGGLVLIKNEIGLYSNPLLAKYLGVVFKTFSGNDYTINTKQREIMTLIVEKLKNLKSFNYTFHFSIRDFMPFYWNGFNAKVQYTYIIDFESNTIDNITKSLQPKLRNLIKKTVDENYLINWDVNFLDFYHVVSMSFQRQGGDNPFKKKFLENYTNSLIEQNKMKLVSLSNSTGIMAVAGIIYDKNSTNLVLNGVNNLNIKKGANELLIFETIKFAYENSKYYDFEGSMLFEINSFYKKFGGKQTQFLKVYKDNLFNYSIEKSIKFYKKIKYGK